MGERLFSVALILCACGSSEEPGSSGFLAPPPEDEGLQLKIEVSLQPLAVLP